MYFSVARAVIVILSVVALTGCQSGVKWPWAKKDPAVSQGYPSGATPPASYSNQASSGVQLPTSQSAPYGVGNNYAPQAPTQTAGAGLYPEAVGEGASGYPGAAGSYGAGPGYGTASNFGTGAAAAAGAYSAAAPPAVNYPAAAYPSASGPAMTPQEGMYGNPSAATAAGGYPPNAYGAATPPYGATPGASYAAPASAYPQTASSYPSTGADSYPQGAAQTWTPPASDPNTYPGGGPVAQTADSRYSRYDSSAPPPASGGYSPPATESTYPATSAPAGAAGAGGYQGSTYPTTPASTAPYRPGGTSDYVPTSQGGNVPSGYGATGSGVRPAGYDEPAGLSSATPGAANVNTLNVVTPVEASAPAAAR